jgi:hypothetical protein
MIWHWISARKSELRLTHVILKWLSALRLRQQKCLHSGRNSSFRFNRKDNSGKSPSSFVLAEATRLQQVNKSTMPPRLISPFSYRVSASLWKSYSTAPRVSLAYDLHEPGDPSSNAPGAIIFLHGLFGSKKNNRSISK